MQGEELAELSRDIAKHGLLSSVVIYQGQIIDGRNRASACELAGVQIKCVILELPEDVSPTEWVLSINSKRRHLTPSQKATVACLALPMLEEEAKERMKNAPRSGIHAPSTDKGRSRDKAAAMVGVNPRYVAEAKKIQEHAPEVFEQIQTGEKTLNEAKREVENSNQPPPPPPIKVLDAEKEKAKVLKSIQEFDDHFPEQAEVFGGLVMNLGRIIQKAGCDRAKLAKTSHHQEQAA